MLSLLISLSIIQLLFQLYLTIQRSYHTQAALNQIQHQAQEIIHAMRSAIHKAGYIGCPRLSGDFSLISHTTYTLTPQNKIQAASNGPIIVRHASFAHVSLTEKMRNLGIIKTDKHIAFKPGHILIISDCKHAEIFEVKQIKTQAGNQIIVPNVRLRYRYDINSEVARFVQDKYEISADKQLIVHDISDGRNAIADGIEAMHVEVTLNQSGVYREVPADAVNDWSQAVGVSISLLLSSPPNKKSWYFYAALP